MYYWHCCPMNVFVLFLDELAQEKNKFRKFNWGWMKVCILFCNLKVQNLVPKINLVNRRWVVYSIMNDDFTKSKFQLMINRWKPSSAVQRSDLQALKGQIFHSQRFDVNGAALNKSFKRKNLNKNQKSALSYKSGRRH